MFDLDDTLYDKSATLSHYADYLFDNRLTALNLCPQQFKEAFITQNSIIQPKAQAFSLLASQFNFSTQLSDDLLKEFDNTLHEFSVSFPGVHESLTELKNNEVSIGCITNGRDFFQRNKIRALGLDTYFDFIVTSGELGIKKPDPAIFQAGLDLFSNNSDQVCFCGDNLSADIQPAKQLGMTTFWKTRASSESEFADYVFNDFSEFDEIWLHRR